MISYITRLYKTDYLLQIWHSLPKENCEWVIVKLYNKEIPYFLEIDPRIKIVNLPFEEDTLEIGYKKLEYGIENMSGTHFQILDDDTIIHPNSINVYFKNKNRKIIIGNQHYFNNTLRLKADWPKEAAIDTGSVICSKDVYPNVKWTDDMVYCCPDFKYWKDAVNHLKDVVIIEEPISYYNYLINQKIG